MLTKEIIDEFIENNAEIEEKINEIAKRYSINDFVLFSKEARDYFVNQKPINDIGVYGCIYDSRNKHLRIDIDVVESRLRTEYMDLLGELLEDNRDTDIVFYVVAYHYLTLCKDIACSLTVGTDASFPFFVDEISPLGKDRLELYNKISNSRGELYRLLGHFYEEDLKYFNSIFWELRYHHHNAKHFSLINYLINIDMSRNVTKCYFDNVFKMLLDVFVFRFKAIYTEVQLCAYTSPEVKKMVIDGLVEW